MTAQRVTGHLKFEDRQGGRVYYAKTRVPGRVPEQTTRRLGPAGSLTLKAAKDALADLLADERRKVGEGIYEAPASAVTFAVAADAYLHHVEHVKGREQATVKDYRESIARYHAGATHPSGRYARRTSKPCATTSWRRDSSRGPSCGT